MGEHGFHALITQRRPTWPAGGWTATSAWRSRTRPTSRRSPSLGVRRAEVERADHRGARAFDEGPWADLSRRTGRGAARAYRPPRGDGEPTRRARWWPRPGQPTLFAEMAQFTAGIALARGTIDLYLSMSHEEANPVPVDELVRGPGGAEHSPPRAGRRGRRDHAVQRRVHHGVPEDDPGADGRQLGDPAAEPADAVSSLVLRCGRRGRRAAAGRAQRRRRGRRRRRGTADHPSGRRHGVVHRLDRGRASRSSPRRRRP